MVNETPLIIFLGVVWVLIKEFDKWKLNDIELDELDRDNIN